MNTDKNNAIDAKPRALIGWRLLALAYDLWPVLALWILVAVPFTVGYTFLGHHDSHQNIPPYSLLWWLLWLSCWIVAGAVHRAQLAPRRPDPGHAPVAIEGDRGRWRRAVVARVVRALRGRHRFLAAGRAWVSGGRGWIREG